MKADIKNNQFTAFGICEELQYEILNPDNLEYNMNSIFVCDKSGNKKFIPEDITETTCKIIINPLYQEEYGE